MTTIKKAYQPIVEYLNANLEMKVKNVIDQVIAFAEAKAGRVEGSTFVRDASGAVVAINDYYFKRWMPLVGEKAVDFGAKQKSATGFNTMCKEGVSAWTKQQREAKNAMAALLTKVASGEVQPSDIAAEQAKIEEARKAILPTELGFESIDELNAYLVASGVTL